MSNIRPINDGKSLPSWLPDMMVVYLAHTTGGLPLRALARARGCHASTILRQVRKVETRRDDPLIDEALERVGPKLAEDFKEVHSPKEIADMVSGTTQRHVDPDPRVAREARRILRRLCEKGAFLAVAPNMDKAVVMREVVPGCQNRIAVMDRDIAHAFALQEWISCDRAGKVARYSITTVGRAALKRLLAVDRAAREPASAFGEASTPFRAQHQEMGERLVMASDGSGEKTLRCNLAESPLSILARKRDSKGKPYLGRDLIEAGERLREDFELAQMGPRIAQNWERFLTAQDHSNIGSSTGGCDGPSNARKRVSTALSAMGPGLGDIVFRVCCFLEGLETAEKRMGWSARSGKVVLKIALQRLAEHYGIRRVEAGLRRAN